MMDPSGTPAVPVLRFFSPRPRLDGLLAEGLTRRLTVLVAPTGMGKTTALRHFAGGCGMPTAYVSFVDTPEPLAAGAVARSVRLLVGPTPTGAAGETGPGSEAEDLVDALGVLARDVVLILDNLERVSPGTATAHLLERFVRRAGPQVHVFLASQHPLFFSTVQLKARQEAAEVSADALRFQEPEVKAFLEQRLGWQPDPRLVRHVLRLTEGWAVPLLLLADGFRHGSPETTELPDRLPDDLRVYLDEVFAAEIPADMLDLLEHAALVERVSPALCDAVFGRLDSAEVLREAAGSLCHVRSLGRELYRIAEPCRSYLQERLLTRLGPQTVADLHREIARWYAASSDVPLALTHYLAANEMSAANRLLSATAPRWMQVQGSPQVLHLLAGIPPAGKRAWPWIALCEARLRQYAGELEQGVGLARQALGTFEAAGDRIGVALAAFVVGDMLGTWRQYEGARAVVDMAWQGLTAEDRYAEGLLRLHRGMLQVNHYGNRAAAEEEYRAALMIFVELGEPGFEAIASDMVGMMQSYVGHYSAAIRYHQRAVDLGVFLGEPSYERGVNLTWAFVLAGQFAEAAELAEEIVARSERALRRAFASSHLLYAYTRMGEFEKALEFGRQAEALSKEVGAKILHVRVLTSYAQLYRFMGNPETGVVYAQEALRLLTGMETISARAETQLAAANYILFVGGNQEKATRLAEKVVYSSSSTVQQHHRLTGFLILAVARCRQARHDLRVEGAALLAETLSEMQRLSMDILVLHDWELGLAGVLHALAAGVRHDVCRSLLSLMADRLPERIRSSGVRLHDAELKVLPAAWQELADDEERTTLRTLLRPADLKRIAHLTNGPAPLEIHCLRAVSVTIGGVSVAPAALKKRKATELLTMLVSAESTLSREWVIEALWPEQDAAAADRNLRVSLHHLRRLLEPSPTGWGESRYVRSENGLLSFVRRPEVTIDVDVFRRHAVEGAKARQLGQLAAAERAYTEAIRLYGGDAPDVQAYPVALIPVRKRLQQTYVDMLDWLTGYYLEHHDMDKAIRTLTLRLADDPGHEPAHQALIRIYIEQGKFPAAQHQYLRCREMLRLQYDVTPSQETEQLADLIAEMGKTVSLSEHRRQVRHQG